MFTFALVTAVALTLIAGYAQQKLYPHDPDVPLGWWMVASAALFTWFGLLGTAQSYDLPEMMSAFFGIMASPGAAFADLVGGWTDGIFLVLGLLIAIMTIFQMIVAWPLGALLSIGLFIVAFRDHDKVEANMQAFFVVTQFYGWFYWFTFAKRLAGLRSDPFSSIWNIGIYPKLSAAARLKHVSAYDLAFAAIVVMAIAVSFLHFVGDHVAGETSQHGVLIGASIVAQMLNARKHWFGWGLWAIVNLIGMGVYAVENNPGLVLLSVMFFILSIIGLFKWYYDAMAQRKAGLPSEIV